MKNLIKTKKRKALLLLALLVAFIYLNNTSHLAQPRTGKPFLLAHRGLAQTFSMEGLNNQTNTAQRIFPPEHPYLENTIASMEAAFGYGTDIVELDIQSTKDGQLAVFHDAVLEYRTNGKGSVKDHSMSELKQLDIGYGYTVDGGQSYPFRGKGTGLMPSLEEVFKSFPDRSFLIHIKSNDARDGEDLADYLSAMPVQHLSQLAVYGGDKPVAVLKNRFPELRVMSMASLKDALLSYAAIGWTGYVPASCRNTEIHIPLKYAAYLWGWPDRFLNRMDSVNTRVIVVAGDGGFSEGFDTVEDLKLLPAHYTGGIWTNRIDRIAPLFTQQ